MAEVTISNVYKRYGAKGAQVSAVRDLNLDIREREFMVLVGPSGCGKTTALRMVAGLEEISDGTISIGGRVVNDVEPKDRDIAMVFQNYALYPHMSVRDNMAFALKLRNVAKDEIDRRVGDAARMLDLEPYLKRKPGALSGGQRQRVALGRAIVREPKVFLMDEPLSNLDAKLRVQTRAEIIKLHRRLGITTIYVTHDQVEAMTMGDRIAVMRDGVLQQCDTPMAIYKRPVNMFVAGFIGMPPMNFLNAQLERDADGAYWADLGFTRVLIGSPKKKSLDIYSGRRVVIGLRPSDIKDVRQLRESELAASNTMRVNVDAFELMGDTSTVHVNVAHEGKQQYLIAQVAPDLSIKDGAELELAFDPASLHLFDEETQVAITLG